MTVSQQLSHVNENSYDDSISVMDIPKGYFPAVTSNTLAPGSTTREVGVEILPLEQSPGGKMETNTGLYIRGADETAVKVTVSQDGSPVADNTQAYS